MKRIKFTSAHGQSHVETPDVGTGRAVCAHAGCGEQGGWHDGDVKSVSDDDAATLLSNPQFAEAGDVQAKPSGAHARPVSAPSASSTSDDEE